jgi:hypothetical protein
MAGKNNRKNHFLGLLPEFLWQNLVTNRQCTGLAHGLTFSHRKMNV